MSELKDLNMIRLTRINHKPVVLNADLIEHIEITPDTVISLTTGQKMVVLETAEEVVQRVIEFRRLISGLQAVGPVIQSSCDDLADEQNPSEDATEEPIESELG